MGCSICTVKDLKDLKISKLKFPRSVNPGDDYTINVTVESLAVLYGDTAKLCLYDRTTGTLIRSLDNHIPPGLSEIFTFNELMPDLNMDLHLSLIDENLWPIPDNCEDFRNFSIPTTEDRTNSDLIIILMIAAVIALLIILRR